MSRIFAIGNLAVTAAVDARGETDADFRHHVAACLRRHMQGDWGEMDPSDKALNDAALDQGGARLHSAYKNPEHPEIWIITEADRSVTTILFPNDY